MYSEGYSLSATPRIRVEEFYSKHKRYPQDNAQAGLSPPHTIYGTNIKHVSIVRDGTVVVQFNDEFGDSTMVFTPRTSSQSGILKWDCSSDSIDAAVMSKLRPRCVYLPATNESKLMRAIANKDVQKVREKLKADIDLEILINGNTPLMLAAKIGNVDVVQLLLDAGANIDHATINTLRRTPLMIAIASQHAEIASLLLSEGASVKRTDYSGKSALDYAKLTDARSSGSRFELMLAAKFNPLFAGNQDDNNATAEQSLGEDRELYARLKFAIGRCYVKQLENLLSQSNDYSPTEVIDGNPLRALVGQTNCSAKLASFVKDKKTWKRITFSALQMSVDDCNVNAGNTLLAENPDVNLIDVRDGTSVLSRAFQSGCTDILHSLLRHSSVARPLSSDIVVDAIRTTPQHALLRSISILMNHGAELNKRDSKSGRLPLSLAINYEQPVLAKYLLDAGALVSSRTVGGSYPLIDATKKGYHHLVVNLIDKGADVNNQDKLGRTALHAAVAKGKKRTVEVLLQAGANPHIQDIDGIDSILMARSKRYESIQAVLEN